MSQQGHSTPPLSENAYTYNGKELTPDFGIALHDYGARQYDAANGRWTGIDPMAEKYAAWSPYNYVLGNPTNAIDPDGKLVIFINGNHFGGVGGNEKYWRSYRKEKIYGYVYAERTETFVRVEEGTRYVETRAFDKGVMEHLQDYNAMYKDGSLGGYAPLNSVGNNSLRRAGFGKSEGYRDAEKIVARLTRDQETGKITETIKIITHSMGGAYGKGYVKGLKKWLKENGYEEVLISLVADFDAFQAGKLTADENIYTQQFDHRNLKGAAAGDFPWLGGNENQEGVDDPFLDKTQSAHNILSFFGDIANLKEGTYKWNETNKSWECTNCR